MELIEFLLIYFCKKNFKSNYVSECRAWVVKIKHKQNIKKNIKNNLKEKKKNAKRKTELKQVKTFII